MSNDNGFIVTLRDERESLVGAGYFSASAHEGVYGVGVYDRSLFAKPLGHVVQLYAIQELQRRGCKWYHIGTRRFPGEGTAATEKDLSIGAFKHGFSTGTFPSFVFTHHEE